MEAVTERTLRTASERAVAGGHAIGAVLFGSRARGAPGPMSDWDVCLVTDDVAGDALARDRALEADDAFWEHPAIETHWLSRARFEGGVPAGSIEAAIARDGQGLAGETAMATKARSVPFETETVLRNLGRASEHLHTSIEAARRHSRESDETQRGEIAVTLLVASIAGAEALARALCALTETEHTGDHRIAKNARQIAERAAEAEPPLEVTLMREISACVEALDDTTQAVRKVEYGEPGEDPAKTLDRFVRALDTDLLIRRGLIEGTGAWSGLAEHPRREELAEELRQRTAARAAANAREWGSGRIELADKRAEHAVRRWIDGHDALGSR